MIYKPEYNYRVLKHINQTQETMQSHVITIQSKYRDDATLPRPETFNITQNDLDDYIDLKQNYIDWKQWCKKKGIVIVVFLACIPMLIIGYYDESAASLLLALGAGLLLAAVIITVWWLIDRVKSSKFKNNSCEAFLRALATWEHHHF